MAVKDWKEAELMLHFQLTKIAGTQTPLMEEWLDTSELIFTPFEAQVFENNYQNGLENVAFWSEEDLKMYFITHILSLGGLMNLENKGYVGVFEKRLSATINDTKLAVRADFVVAKGFKNIVKDCYFHFQEYKPQLRPPYPPKWGDKGGGEPMGQLLEAFLIGQAKNAAQKPLYGCEVIGGSWKFVIMEHKTYCVSRSFDCTERGDLLKIIAILRKFRDILETRLLL